MQAVRDELLWWWDHTLGVLALCCSALSSSVPVWGGILLGSVYPDVVATLLYIRKVQVLETDGA